jgi:hypothetical protein
VPGLRIRLQFQSTANRQLSGVEFYVDRFFEQPGDEYPRVRAFLRALIVPPEGTEDVNATARRVLFIWPEVVIIEASRASSSPTSARRRQHHPRLRGQRAFEEIRYARHQRGRAV